MKHPFAYSTTATLEPNEEAVRDYAYHLYQLGNYEPGHDLDNWLEATACLKANIPTHASRSRLHHHMNTPGSGRLHEELP